MPKVSVVMPVFNGERYLREAIDSILSQDFPDFEFVIVDDGSTDSSLDILEEYKAKDTRVVCHKMAQNSGIVSALNAGVNVAKGEYIARMDADDISMQNRIAAQVVFLDDTGIAAVGANYIKFRGSNSTGRNTKLPLVSTEVRKQLPYTCCLGHPTVMFRKQAFDQVGGYSPQYAKGGAEDYDLWLRMSLEHELANLKEPLLRYREHEGSLTASADAGDRYAFNSACAVAAHFCALFGLPSVYPKDGPDAIVEALGLALDRAKSQDHRKCLMRWNIRFARYCLDEPESRTEAKSLLGEHGTFHERLKWWAYGLG